MLATFDAAPETVLARELEDMVLTRLVAVAFDNNLLAPDVKAVLTPPVTAPDMANSTMNPTDSPVIFPMSNHCPVCSPSTSSDLAFTEKDSSKFNSSGVISCMAILDTMSLSFASLTEDSIIVSGGITSPSEDR